MSKTNKGFHTIYDIARKIIIETVQLSDEIEEINKWAQSGYKDAEEIIDQFLNDTEKRHSIWEHFLKDCGVSEHDLKLSTCSLKVDYYAYNQTQLRKKAKEIATILGKTSSKTTEETWKDILRNKGLTEDQMELKDFSFKSSYKGYRLTDLDKVANKCIEIAKRKKII